MQIQVHTLREALTLLGPVVPKKTTLPVLTNVLLRDGQAVATDMEVAVTVELPEAANHAVLMPYRETAEPEDYPPLPQPQPKVEGAVDGDTLAPALLSVVD